jgi:pilus assembly protein Flp/PilA
MMVRFEVVKSLLSSWMSDEEGASLVEYVLLVALIAVVCITAVSLLGKAAKTQFGTATSALNSSPGN